MGAVILMDVYIIPRIGLKSNFAETYGVSVNYAAASAWIFTLLFSLLLNQYFKIEVFFLGLPGWFIAALIYIILSKFFQNLKMIKKETVK